MLTRRQMAVAALGAVVLAGCAPMETTTVAEVPPQSGQVVQMVGTSFDPETIRIAAGQTVQWRNTSSAMHTVTGDPMRAANPENVALPAGAEAFHSGQIAPGEAYERTFTVPGVYRYVCLPHEQLGMIGTIVVEG